MLRRLRHRTAVDRQDSLAIKPHLHVAARLEAAEGETAVEEAAEAAEQIKDPLFPRPADRISSS